MRPALQKKQAIVNEIRDRIKNAKSTVVVQYHKLTVAELTELRKMLAEKNACIKIYKNNLVSLAAKEAGFEKLDEFLVGPNAFAFSNEDEIAAAKVLAKYAKKHPALKLISGIYGGEVIDTKAINEVASLPTKDELIAMFGASLLYPLRMFAIAVKEIAKTRAE